MNHGDLSSAAGDSQRAILGCLYASPIIWLYNACRVDGHSVFLIRDVIYKNVVGLGSGSVQLIYEAENMLTAPHTTELNLIMPCFLQYVFETQCEFSVNSLQLLYLQTPLSAAVLLIFIPILEPESVDKFLSPVSSWSLATVVCINLLLYQISQQLFASSLPSKFHSGNQVLHFCKE